MMQKIILTDADGVLVNWIDGFTKFMSASGYKSLPCSESEYRLDIRYSMTSTAIMEFVKEFNDGPWVADLQPIRDSVEYVGKLVDKGFRFVVITSISDIEDTKVKRIQNLTGLFGNVFNDIICLPTDSSKDHVLENWRDSNLFWIEDHMRHAEAGYEVGLRPILIRQPYNSHFNTDLFPIVSQTTPWKEIYEIICKDYKV